jgi:phosphohistidine phosphatase SixA
LGRPCALADQLAVDRIIVTRIAHSGHVVAAETANVFAAVLESRRLVPPTLAPVASRDLTPGSSTGTVPGDLPVPDNVLRCGRATALMLVGHQPDLTRIARALLWRPRGLVPPPWFVSGLPAGCLPLDGSEIACVRTSGTPRLLWILRERPRELLVDLRDKIRSKLDVAKFFVRALVVNSSILLHKDLWVTSDAPRNLSMRMRQRVCQLL